MQGRRGFSLAEVMVAVVLVSIAALGLISAQIFAIRAGAVNRQEHMASVIGYSVLSSKIQEARSGDTFTLSQSVPRGPVPDHTDFEYQVTDALEPDTDSQLKRLTVTVFWKDRSGEHSYEVWSLVYAR